MMLAAPFTCWLIAKNKMGKLYILFACLLWSLAPFFIKRLDGLIDGISLSFIRFVLGLVVIFIVNLTCHRVFGTKRLQMKLNNKWIWIGGVSIGINYIFFNWGIILTSASVGILILQAQVIVLGILSAVILKEGITRTKISGFSMTSAGILLVAWDGQHIRGLLESKCFFGNLLMFCAGICWAWYALAQKILSKDMKPMESLFNMFIIAALVVSVPMLFVLKIQWLLIGSELPSLLLVGILCSGISYVFFSSGVKITEGMIAGILINSMPLFTIIIAMIVLNEKLSLTSLIGAVGIIAGITIFLKKKRFALLAV